MLGAVRRLLGDRASIGELIVVIWSSTHTERLPFADIYTT